MKSKTALNVILLMALIVSALPFATACVEQTYTPAPTTPEVANTPAYGVTTYDNKQPPYSGAQGHEVKIVNNPNAVNPTWQQLLLFLENDDTDQEAYVYGLRVCAHFAEELHNNAEKAGFRAAWVAIQFSENIEGHALNAFETADRGLVYVDCTGKKPTVIPPPAGVLGSEEPASVSIGPERNDKIAYVEVDKEYGVINTEAEHYPDFKLSPEYTAYEDYTDKLEALRLKLWQYNANVEDFNNRVREFNEQVEIFEAKRAGRTVIDDFDEFTELNELYKELESQARLLEPERQALEQELQYIEWQYKMLGGIEYESPGTVYSVEIFW